MSVDIRSARYHVAMYVFEPRQQINLKYGGYSASLHWTQISRTIPPSNLQKIFVLGGRYVRLALILGGKLRRRRIPLRDLQHLNSDFAEQLQKRHTQYVGSFSKQHLQGLVILLAVKSGKVDANTLRCLVGYCWS